MRGWTRSRVKVKVHWLKSDKGQVRKSSKAERQFVLRKFCHSLAQAQATREQKTKIICQSQVLELSRESPSRPQQVQLQRIGIQAISQAHSTTAPRPLATPAKTHRATRTAGACSRIFRCDRRRIRTRSGQISWRWQGLRLFSEMGIITVSWAKSWRQAMFHSHLKLVLQVASQQVWTYER